MLSTEVIVKNEYRILKVIGTGGMGSVYLCCEVKNPDKKWALKEMQVSTLNKDVQNKTIKNFEFEAQILSKLNHISLPKVKEYFKEKENYYLVMEFIEGENLSKLIDKSDGPFSEELVLKWGIQLSTVIYFLHIQKPPIIYRDLKPSNIMITPDGNIKLIDFGIARFFKPGKKKDTVEMGSLGYAPPEQFGQGQTDERSDIYSIGVTLHQLLTKRDPAESDNPFKIPSVRSLNNQVSSELDLIITRATNFEADKRFQKVNELKQKLKDLYDGKIKQTEQNKSSSLPPTIAIKDIQTLPEENKEKETNVKNDIDVSENHKKLSSKKKNFSIRRIFLKVACILILSLSLSGVGIYYYKDKIPQSLYNYTSKLNFHMFNNPAPTISPYQISCNFKEKGIIKYNEGKFQEAIELLEESLKINPYDPEAMILKSNSMIELNKNENLSIGLIVSKTGNNSSKGKAMLMGALLGVKEINSSGGINGKKIKINIIDDASDLNKSISSISKIITSENLKILIGPYDYILDTGLSYIINKNELLQLSPCLPSHTRLKDRPFSFGMSPDRKSLSKAILNLIYKKLNKEKITIIYDIQNPYFLELNYIFKEEIFSRERNITSEILLIGDKLNEKSQIDRIVNIVSDSKPEVIVFFTSPEAIKKLAIEIRNKELDTIFISGPWAFDNDLIEQIDPLNGLICLSQMPGKNYDNFMKIYNQIFLPDSQPVFITAQVYDSLMLLNEAIKTKGFQIKEIKNYFFNFNKNNPYSGISGVLYFTGTEGERDIKWMVLQKINLKFNIHISNLQG